MEYRLYISGSGATTSCLAGSGTIKREDTSMETEFTPWMSLAGGILIGLSAILLMAFNGRIAGMTGI
jgi:hypothetical protein